MLLLARQRQVAIFFKQNDGTKVVAQTKDVNRLLDGATP